MRSLKEVLKKNIMLLFLPMRGYEIDINTATMPELKLFLPMRGYERQATTNHVSHRSRLFLPMRGYESFKFEL